MNRNPLIWTCRECGHQENILLLNNNYCCSICGYTKPKETESLEPSYSDNFPQISFNELLKKELKSIKDWEKLKDYPLRKSVGTFMSKLTDLYLDYYQNHLEAAKAIAKEFSNDLFWAAAVIREHFVSSKFLYYSSSDDIDASWNNICWIATEIKIYDDMFGDITVKLDADTFWEFIEMYRNQRIYPDREKIPKNVPYDHWWWFTESEIEGRGELLI